MTTPGTDSQPDVIAVLTTDHAEFLDLISQIRMATDREQQRDLADTVIAEVVRHAVAEEMFVYPAIRKHVPGGDEAVEHDKEEHKDLEKVMKQLESADPAEARFLEVLGEFEQKLRHHANDEETEQFPEMRARIPYDDLVQLAEKVETAKKVAPTRPHPAAPNAALFHKTVGAGVGLVDRLRDKLTGRETSAGS